MGWSPEQIAGRLTLENGRTLISPESIYRFIYHRSAQKDYWHRLLPRAKHKRGRPGRFGGSMVDIIKHRRPLSERPAEVQDRQRPGHWEADFMLFAQYGQSILVAHERSSRFTIIQRPRDRKAQTTAQHLACMLMAMPQAMRRTITFDNGPEFAQHHQLADRIGIQTYFATSGHPGRKVASKMPSAGCAASCRAKPTSTPSIRQAFSLPPTNITIRPGNASTSKRPPRHSLPAEAFSQCQSHVALQT
ncbi:IS30 family transposase [Sphingobium yanoikuyae]|uniref:IS30 family transposase n=1 Tax=Sphingobium yanoikuyae TaxID=13690 RepID=UPI0028A63DEF|nr:IS30 family transposase [Sphingobium yanoikuyae]